MRPDHRSGHASVNDLARWAGRGLILPNLRLVPSQRRAGVAGLMDEAPESHPQLPEGNRSANENRAVPHEHRHCDTGQYAQRLPPLHDRENAPIPPGTKVPRGPGKPSARSLLMIGDGRWLSRPDKLPEVQHFFFTVEIEYPCRQSPTEILMECQPNRFSVASNNHVTAKK